MLQEPGGKCVLVGFGFFFGFVFEQDDSSSLLQFFVVSQRITIMNVNYELVIINIYQFMNTFSSSIHSGQRVNQNIGYIKQSTVIEETHL